jgi:hypothetical protein
MQAATLEEAEAVRAGMLAAGPPSMDGARDDEIGL